MESMRLLFLLQAGPEAEKAGNGFSRLRIVSQLCSKQLIETLFRRLFCTALWLEMIFGIPTLFCPVLFIVSA
jgi:hypothetical protein